MTTCTVPTRMIDWAEMPLPPCTEAVRVGVWSPLRHARLTQAYHCPTSVVPDPAGAGRERRYAAGQTVVVAPDGSVLATWYERAGEVVSLHAGAVDCH